MKFVLSGKMDKEKYQGKIEALGGTVSNTVTKEVIALISDKGKKLYLTSNINSQETALLCSAQYQYQ